MLINITNSTLADDSNNANWGDINGTIGTEILIEPSNDYQLKTVCYGNLDQGGDNQTADSAIVTNVIVDRGDVPITPTTLLPAAGTQDNSTLSINAVVVGVNVTTCTLNFESKNPGQKAYAMTHTGDTCYLAISNVADDVYIWDVTASDGTNSSTSSQVTTTIKTGTGSGARKAKIGAALGGGTSQEQVERGLAIATATRAGEVSAGLEKARIKFNEFTAKEKQPIEMVKTGGGIVGGAIIGASAGTIALPVIGTVAGGVVGAIIGGILGIVV